MNEQQVHNAAIIHRTGGWTTPEYGLEIDGGGDRHIRVNVLGEDDLLQVVPGQPGQDVALRVAGPDGAKFTPGFAAVTLGRTDRVPGLPGGITVERHPDGVLVSNASVKVLLRQDEAKSVLADLRTVWPA